MKTLTYILAVSIFLMNACESNQVENNAEENAVISNNSVLKLSEEQIRRAGIQVGEAETRSISGEIAFTGFIEVPPENLHSIHTPIRGFVSSVPVIEGDKVRKGQVIATLSHPDIVILQQDYIKEWSKLTLFESELNRQKELLSGQATAEKKLETAQSSFEIQKALVNGIESQLKVLNISSNSIKRGEIKESINIVSPANGTISILNINAGKLVDNNELLIEVIDRAHLHIELHVFEKDISKVSIGQNFEFFIPGIAEEFQGEVYLIGQRVDPVRKTVLVHGHPKIENDKFIAGMQIRGKLKLNQREVLSIPSSAVIIDGEDAYIYMVRGEEFHRTKVEVVLLGNGQYYELLTPISEGMAVEGVWFLESYFQQE